MQLFILILNSVPPSSHLKVMSQTIEMREHIGQSLLPFVSGCLPDVHFRVKKCYALVLATGRLVSCMVVIDICC